MSYTIGDLREFAKAKIEALEFSIKQTAFISVKDGLEKELELTKIALRALMSHTE